MNKSIVALALGLLSSTAMADQFSVPKQTGWDGHVGVGFGFYNIESNLFAGTRLQDTGDENIDLNKSPNDNNESHAELTADVRYTWGDTRTQVFIGNLVEDQVRLDWTQQAGIRKQFDKYGIIGGSVLFSSIPVEVWEDPYIQNDRQRTDRDSGGVRLSWTQIMNSPFGFNLSYRDIDVDEDRAGEGLVTQAEQELLRRDGDNQHLQVFGRWIVGQHLFMPAVHYTAINRDGKAEEGDYTSLEMTYAFFHEKYTFTASGLVGKRDFDAENPVFDKKADSDEFGLTAVLFWHEPLDYKDWDLRVTATYANSDSDIAFFDSKVFGTSIVAQYNF